jgi:hypothetical protein
MELRERLLKELDRVARTISTGPNSNRYVVGEEETRRVIVFMRVCLIILYLSSVLFSVFGP